MTTKSNRAKGSDFQRWCKKWLEEHGYTVHNQITAAVKIRGMWISKRNDIFGCDLIAIKEDEMPRYIQATLHSSVNKRLEEMGQFPWPLVHVFVELWTKVDSGRIVIKRYNGKEFHPWGEIQRGKLLLHNANI